VDVINQFSATRSSQTGNRQECILAPVYEKNLLQGFNAMKLRKEELPVALELPVATFRVAEWDDTSIAYVKLTAGADATPLLKGLPEDKCQCPHWGYMLEGAIHVRYSNGKEEICKAGEVFHWPAGHTVWVEEDTSFIEFSPKKELKTVYDHIGDKLASVSK
jgi:hypothetical protein